MEIIDRKLKEDKLVMAFKKVKSELSSKGLERIEALIYNAVKNVESEPSVRISPFQEVDLRLYMPDLEAKPWHNVPPEWVTKLENAYPTIKEEYFNLLDNKKKFSSFLSGSGYLAHGGFGYEEALIKKGEWTAFFFQAAYRKCEAERALCPRTASILDQLPVAREALFSVLAPNTQLRPHSDLYNFVLTLHLGLVIPEDCGIQVGDQPATWEEGKCLMFDSSFVHEAWNRSNKPRIALLIDMWHPGLTPVEIKAFNKIRPAIEEFFELKPRRAA